VEMEAGLGSGPLQGVESGRVVRPERGILARVLDAPGARYSERRDVLDRTQRLLAWNRPLRPLFGTDPADLAGRSMLAPRFDPGSPLGRLVAAPDEFLPALIRSHRFRMGRFRDEAWFAALTDALRALPTFRRDRRVVASEPEAVGAARALVPLRLRAGGGGAALAFRLASEPSLRDDRFRNVYLCPADPPTMDWTSRARPA
jgi:hypothetical protein